MKKIIVLILLCSMILSLAACGKSEQMKLFETSAGAIGEITLDSENVIAEAEKAFAALTEEEKLEVAELAQKVTNSRETFDHMVKLDEVVTVIEAVGEVTLDSEAQITKAEEAFNKLSKEEQNEIAESAAVLQKARADYEALANKQAVDQVTAAIDAIGDVTLESQEAIEQARKLYQELNAVQQGMVSNIQVLNDAETAYAKLAAAEKQRLIDTYSAKFNIEVDKVQGITWYMHKDTPEYIDTRCYLNPYLGVQEDNVWIIIRYNYTEDDWIFWNNMTILVDGEKYIKAVNYYDMVRDNANGVVWEWYDEPLTFNQPLDSEELEMLQKIADSEETIVRFNGQDYYYDLTVNNTDKQIIRDVLALYSGLIG